MSENTSELLWSK